MSLRRFPPTAVVLCALGLGLLLESSVAWAEEQGIKVGEGRLHPYLTLGANWQSFASLTPTAPYDAQSDLLWEIRPGFRLSIPSPTLAFDLGGEADFIFYNNESLLNRFLASADLGLGVNRQGVVGFELADQFVRSDNNSLVAVPYAIISNFNDASAKVPIRPGGGALIFEPGYRLILDHFDPFNSQALAGCTVGNPLCDPSQASEMDYYINQGLLNVRWHFLPKTSLLFDGNFSAVGYPNEGSGTSANAPLDLVNASIGLSGLVTSRIEVVLKAGYSQTILTAQATAAIPGLQVAGNEHTVIGQAQLGYLFSDTAFIRGGYVRLLLPSPTVLSYYTDDRPYLNTRALVAGILMLRLDVTYDIMTFPLNSAGQTVGRKDQNLWVDVGPEVEILRWLRVTAGYAFTNRASSDQFAFFYNTTSAFGGYGYSNNQVYLRVTFIY